MTARDVRRLALLLLPCLPPFAVEVWSSVQWYMRPNWGNVLLSGAMAAVIVAYLWLVVWRGQGGAQ